MEQIAILVVDDEKEIADLVEIYLVSDGYKVFKANNAKEGLEILEKEEIHLVLLDIMMPGMDGLEMCRKIRETNNIPIIMLSAKSPDLDKILGLGTGADDYVVKRSYKEGKLSYYDMYSDFYLSFLIQQKLQIPV